MLRVSRRCYSLLAVCAGLLPLLPMWAVEDEAAGPVLTLSLDLGQLRAHTQQVFAGQPAALRGWRYAQRHWQDWMTIDSSVPPLLELLAEADGLRVVAALLSGQGPSRIGLPDLQVELRANGDLPHSRSWWRRLANDYGAQVSASAADFGDWHMREQLQQRGLTLVASSRSMAQRPLPIAAAQDGDVLRLDYDLGPVLALLDGDLWRSSLMLLQHALAGPAAAPHLQLRLAAPSPEGWQQQLQLRHLPARPLTVAGRWLAYRRADSAATAIAAVDPAWLLRAAFILASSEMAHNGALEVEGERLWRALSGLSVGQTLAMLEGIVIVNADWPRAGDWRPRWVVTLPLVDAVDATQLAQVLAALGLEEVAQSAAARWWQTPPERSPWSVVWDGQALHLATDAEAIDHLLAAAADSTIIADDTVLDVRVSAAAMGQLWTTLSGSLYTHIQAYPEPLSDSLDRSLQMAVWSLPDIALRERATMPWYSYWSTTVRRSLLSWRGDMDEEVFFSEAMAVFLPGPRVRLSRPALVVRREDGWFVQHGWQILRGPMDEATVIQALADFIPVAGPPLAELRVIPHRPQPRFDLRWLPPLDLLVALQPPAYHFSARAQDGDLLATEDGLPLFTLASAAAALVLQQGAGQMLELQRERARERTMAAFFIEHPEYQQAVTAVATAVDRYRSDFHSLPQRLSRLLEMEYLQLDDLHPLLAARGEVTFPASDALGQWYPQVDDQQPQRPVWVLDHAAGWRLWVGAWGNFGLEPLAGDATVQPAAAGDDGE